MDNIHFNKVYVLQADPIFRYGFANNGLVPAELLNQSSGFVENYINFEHAINNKLSKF